MTTVSDYTSLLSGESWWGAGASNTPVFLTYSFETSPQPYLSPLYSDAYIASFRPFDATDQQLARDALQQWDTASGIRFLEVPAGNGDLRFGKYDFNLDPRSQGSAGTAWYPSVSLTAIPPFESEIGGDVFISWRTSNSVGLLLHEIGHAIGLKHPFDDDPILRSALDTKENTVMSYTGASPTVLGPFDLRAAQYLYGLSSADGTQVASWSWDQTTDTLTQTGGPGNDTMRGVGVADIMFGGDGADNLFGGSGNDALDGGVGNDSLAGGRGADTFVFAPGYKADRITDFAASGGDRIDLSGFTNIRSLSEVLARTTHRSGDTVIDLSNGDKLTLSRVSVASLTATQFLFWVGPLLPVGTGNFDSNARSDLVLGSDSGTVALWTTQGSVFSQTIVPNASMGAEWRATAAGDFNNDGTSDILWTRAAGDASIWLMNGTTLRQLGSPAASMGAEWHIAGVGDFGGDSKADIAWGNNSGQAAIWSMDGITLGGFGMADGRMGAEWGIALVGDFSGDRRQDFLWVSNTGDVTDWLMNGSNLVGLNDIGHMGLAWHAAGSGDVTGDGIADAVWVDTANNVQIWAMNNGRISQFINPTGHNGLEWHFKEAADFTGDGRADLLWLTDAGAAQTWSINGSAVTVLAMTTPGGAVLTAQNGGPVSSAGAADATAPTGATGFDDIVAPQFGWAAGDMPSGTPVGGDIASPSDGGSQFIGLVLDETWLGVAPDPNWGAA
jgi:hypothetical protein